MFVNVLGDLAAGHARAMASIAARKRLGSIRSTLWSTLIWPECCGAFPARNRLQCGGFVTDRRTGTHGLGEGARVSIGVTPVTGREESRSPMAGTLAIEATADLPKPAYGVRSGGNT
ncbi:hypothetical protein [Phytohabitans houttuyneae]|uniref:Uncharacterized protein n=1 Tax=Phytohabitans houttuyneae TaxID=1076126 RepID=A0A6V8KLN1_9ACTN|nr:hypothetical protein [Phytohabitans houttuyneae]GFJ82647.1 hypothetical protein Phou_068270 [Phytohabitans houttuyneae]